MDCKITFIRRRRRGFTLPELLIAIAIGGVVLTAVAALSFYTARSFAAISNYVELDQASRQTLDRMSQKIRQADRLLAFAPNELTFLYEGEELTYSYSADDRTLTETFDDASKVLLTECDSLIFEIFQRNPVNGAYEQFPATMTNNTAKLIQVTWTCSRLILGQKVNTESVQSAKIVIRKQ
jgi:prepilin-type N-terminal cleavage/methylation domain-containing protein